MEKLDAILGLSKSEFGVTCCKSCRRLKPPKAGRLGCPFYPGELYNVTWVTEKQITSKLEPWCSDYEKSS